MRTTATPTDALAALIAFADDPNRRKPVGVDPAYDGPEVRAGDDWSQRDLDALADRRADGGWS